jgi:hypothetical protein
MLTHGRRNRSKADSAAISAGIWAGISSESTQKKEVPCKAGQTLVTKVETRWIMCIHTNLASKLGICPCVCAARSTWSTKILCCLLAFLLVLRYDIGHQKRNEDLFLMYYQTSHTECSEGASLHSSEELLEDRSAVTAIILNHQATKVYIHRAKHLCAEHALKQLFM